MENALYKYLFIIIIIIIINSKGFKQDIVLQDQMLRLPGFLHWWNWQKPQHKTDWTVKRATRNGDASNHIAVHHQLTNHNIDWDSA